MLRNERLGLRIGWLLSVVITLLMAATAAAGLTVPELYQDPVEVATMFQGYDLVVLVVVVPLFELALFGVWRGSRVAMLVWVGLLMYAVYTYAFYTFGTTFNAVFLAHVALLVLSLVTLALVLANLDRARIRDRFHQRMPARLVGALLGLLAASLAGMWVFYSLRFAITGARPSESALVLPLASVHLAYVMDLAFLVPTYALAAILLVLRRSWGYVLGPAALVFSLVFQVNYMSALAFQSDAGIEGAAGFDPAAPFIVGLLLIAAVPVFVNLRTRPARRSSARLRLRAHP